MIRHLLQLQVTAYTMCGGGLLGRLAAEQPKDFYIDPRVGRLPYAKRDIFQTVAVIIAYCEVLGVDPKNVRGIAPPGETFFDAHNCGIF